MRILIFASGDLWAGAETMIHCLIQGLTHIPETEIHAVLLNDTRLAEQIRALGVPVTVFDETELVFFQIVRHFRRFINNYRPDIVHSHRYKENIISWMATEFSRNRPRLLATQHGMPETHYSASVSLKLRKNLLLRFPKFLFDDFIVVSEHMKQQFIQFYGFKKHDISVIHNGIPITREETRPAKKNFIVGSAGRLFPIKAYDLFVNIAHLVLQKNTNITFKLAGDGPEREKLENIVYELNLTNNFKFLGHLDSMDAFYEDIDIFINTSIHEGIPMSVLEAMSYGLPVICGKVGGFPEMITNNEEGFLIENRSAESYAERILILVENSQQYQSMGYAARQRVHNQFSQKAMTAKYFSKYKNLLHGN